MAALIRLQHGKAARVHLRNSGGGGRSARLRGGPDEKRLFRLEKKYRHMRPAVLDWKPEGNDWRQSDWIILRWTIGTMLERDFLVG